MSAYAPGAAVEWLNPDDGQWHPGTVKFDCCQASGPFVLVIDEFGWGHLQREDAVRTPRAAEVARAAP